MLISLIKTPSSKIISIRAAFWLIFMQRFNITSRTISNWFENESNMIAEKRYNILLQQTLYEGFLLSCRTGEEEIVEYLKKHSCKYLDTFINELYNYLYKKDINYLSDPTPDYINIALKFTHTGFDLFRSVVRKSSFGEEKFKRELYLYHENKRTNCTNIIWLYAAFGEMIVELIDMLKLIEENEYCTNGWMCLKNIRQVSNPEIIGKIFERLDLVAYCTKSNRFLSVVKLLVQLAQIHVVSSVEVHQRISPIIKKISFENDNKEFDEEKYIFDCLLDLSCIKNEVKKELAWKIEKVFTENDIDKEFEKKNRYHDKNSTLFLRRNFFLPTLRSISNSSC